LAAAAAFHVLLASTASTINDCTALRVIILLYWAAAVYSEVPSQSTAPTARARRVCVLLWVDEEGV